MRVVRNYLKIGDIYGHAPLDQSQKQRKKTTIIPKIDKTCEKSIEKDNSFNRKR